MANASQGVKPAPVNRIRCMAPGVYQVRGLSGIKHTLLGSIAERVVQKAPGPVRTVKPFRKIDR